MFFKTIAGLLVGNTAVTVMVTGTTEEMTVTIIPKPAKVEPGREVLGKPFSITASAEELDAEFCQALSNTAVKRQSVAEQFDALDMVLEAAKKAAGEKAVKAVTSAAKPAAKAAASAPKVGAEESGGSDDDTDGVGAAAPEAASVAPDNLFAVG